MQIPFAEKAVFGRAVYASLPRFVSMRRASPRIKRNLIDRAATGTPATADKNIVIACDATVPFSEITAGCLMPAISRKYGSDLRCRAVCRSHITRRCDRVPSLHMRHAIPGASICTRAVDTDDLSALVRRNAHAHVDHRNEILVRELIEEVPAAVGVRAAEDKIAIEKQLACRSLAARRLLSSLDSAPGAMRLIIRRAISTFSRPMSAGVAPTTLLRLVFVRRSGSTRRRSFAPRYASSCAVIEPVPPQPTTAMRKDWIASCACLAECPNLPIVHGRYRALHLGEKRRTSRPTCHTSIAFDVPSSRPAISSAPMRSAACGTPGTRSAA